MGRVSGGAANERYPWKVLSVTTFGVTLVFLNSSSVSVAVPALTRQFHADPTQSEWIVFSFMFALSTMILPFGRMSDMLGRRTVYIGGLAAFTAVSLLCGFAWSAPVLIALRVAQGVAAAAIITNITGQLTDVFSGAALGKALGYNMMFVSVANVLGPVVGGTLVDVFGWRSLFWFNVPVGVIGVWWAAKSLRRTAPAAPRGSRFDWFGALVSAIAMGAVLLAVSFGGRWGWSNGQTLLCMAVAVAAVAVFLLLEVFGRHPLVPPALITGSRMRWVSLVSGFFGAMPQSALVVVVALYFQATKQYSALQAGFAVVPLAMGIIVIGPLSGRLISRQSPRWQGAIGGLSTSLGLTGLLLGSLAGAGPVVFGVSLLVCGIGVGLFTPSNTAAIMANVPGASRGSVNGARLVAHNFGLTVGTALALTAMATQLSPTQQDAAYSGSAAVLTGSGSLLQAFAVSFGVLLAAALVQAVASLLRGKASGDSGINEHSIL
jgi:MFS family permease